MSPLKQKYTHLPKHVYLNHNGDYRKTCPKHGDQPVKITKHARVRGGHEFACVECKKEKIKKQYNKKIDLVHAHGKSCIACNYSRSISAYEFHHFIDGEKCFEISELKAYELMYKESLKCLMLCSNCHKEIHDGTIKIDTYKLINEKILPWDYSKDNLSDRVYLITDTITGKSWLKQHSLQKKLENT